MLVIFVIILDALDYYPLEKYCTDYQYRNNTLLKTTAICMIIRDKRFYSYGVNKHHNMLSWLLALKKIML